MKNAKMMVFRDRTDAGQQLAQTLAKRSWHHTLVLALPRGGVPVAIEVAKALKLPLGLLLVKKITAPLLPEYAIGALAEDEAPLWNEDALVTLSLTADDKQQLVTLTRNKIKAQRAAWRPGSSESFLAGLHNQNILLIDDGLATGLTLRAAISCLRRHGANRISVAVPVAPAEAVARFRKIADEVVVLSKPHFFSAVGEWYQDFTQVHDESVTAILEDYKPPIEKPYRPAASDAPVN